MSTPKVLTYHCAFCSHLALATTLPVSSLPTRKSPGLDTASILPLPPPPTPTSSSPSSSLTTVLLLARDRTAVIITREDGFEKRWLWKCGRCKVVVGYQLDECHFEMGPRAETHPNTAAVGGGEGGAGKERGRKERERERERGEGCGFLYLLKGAVRESAELEKAPEVVELV